MAQDVTLTMDGMLLNWLKDVGDSVKKGEVIAEFEADKATVEVEAPADGTILSLKLEVGEEVDEGTVIAQLGDAGEAPAGGEAKAPAAEEAAEEEAPEEDDEAEEEAPASNGAAATTPDGRIKASPLAKRVAAEKGINLAQVAGSGPGGRIVKADVENYKPAPKPAAAPKQPSGGTTIGQSYGKLPEGDDVEIIDVSRMRRLIADGTVTSFQTTPHFYLTIELDVEPLLGLRKEINAMLEDEGVKVSVNDMVVKAAALTQRAFPNLNTHYYGDKLVRHKRVNIAIAVALPNNGLVNVVSPDADTTPLSEMAKYHKQMFTDARDGNIKQEYIKGGTFLVSNLGPYDVESFSSIIDPPESGALAVASARKVPVVKEDGTLGVGTRMKATLSIDHRVSDGAEGAQWLQYFRNLIENPMRLLV
ncbi:2-oxo acid dehydrogenase subunit E2 [Phototrophicus methaneseepsis]|uniref:Dihydrolipoamide acetyltransferase component of pyruvate dehydrogenase complex n=1 Tax=Phototrophicus methaneseepsis TaxID=2710758 RepID=A0A7S8E8V6_9CHLR|nr:dihydrolipoamide acetyltransferase family protein [Phototrophicus methaneseepsis]QPC82487.1 2-oxo acid dehydrogenase subunit E2 [Phototrophicus methaneseepsis]